MTAFETPLGKDKKDDQKHESNNNKNEVNSFENPPTKNLMSQMLKVLPILMKVWMTNSPTIQLILMKKECLGSMCN